MLIMSYSISINYLICFIITQLILIWKNEMRKGQTVIKMAWEQMERNTLVQVGTEIFQTPEKTLSHFM
jgi:hypothetical protein